MTDDPQQDPWLLALGSLRWDNPEQTIATGTAEFRTARGRSFGYTFSAAEHPDVIAAIAAGDWGPVAPFAAPAPTEDDVRSESARRLMIVFAARDRAHLERLIADGTREAVRLLRKGEAEWTAEEVARAAYLTQADVIVDAHDAVSKALRAMSPIPPDFAADAYWPPLG